MNIFHKVALQTMRKSRTRTIVTIIGVILSSALITSVAAFGTSLLNYLINSSVAKYGGWHVEFLDVDSAFAQKLSHDRETADTAVFENMGYAMLEGGKSPEKPYLSLQASMIRPLIPCPSALSPAGCLKTAGRYLSRPISLQKAGSGSR